MTKEQFDNQKWYKNMPVKESTGDPKFTYYVQGVNFETRMVLISLNKNDQWNARWEHDFFIEPVDPIPTTALDLIAAEKHELEKEAWYNDGVVIGLIICKELWAHGTISHEQIRENELYYLDELKSVREKIENLQNKQS